MELSAKLLFRLKTLTVESGQKPPQCFISYAWGNTEHERWVEKILATDLQKAGINILLDRWHSLPGSSIGRFIDHLEKVDRIVVVGSSTYRKKYDNEDLSAGTVIAAEFAQVNARMMGPEKQKGSIIPILLEGEKSTSFPPCLHDRVFSDFRNIETYFEALLELLFSLYQIEPQSKIALSLREELEERGK